MLIPGPLKWTSAGHCISPRTQLAPQPPPQAFPAMIAGEKIRVLLVDDHKILREGLVGLLRTQPDIVVVGEADNGETAVTLARDLEPDVVVMDVSMPNVNGIAATHRISVERPGVRIVALSLHESEQMTSTLIQAGAVAYLTKGGSSDELFAAIRDELPNKPR